MAKDKPRSIITTALEVIKNPIAIGVYLTLLFLFFASTFYKQRSLNEAGQRASLIFEIIDLIDQKTIDFRFKIRGPKEPQSKVALLTIDDRSIEEIGRWPWSREKTAHVINEMFNNQAKALGFDIVFSEPQLDPTMEVLKKIETEVPFLPERAQTLIKELKNKGEPDLLLAKAIQNNSEKIVLGAFNEEAGHNYLPYQDYCRNEAFIRSNAEKFVKLNASFIVNDTADYFESLNFSPIFDQIFEVLEQLTTEHFIKHNLAQKDISDFTSKDMSQIKYAVEQANMNYCNSWLTPEDQFLEPLKESYLALFTESEHLNGKSFEEALRVFKSMIKSHPVIQHERWTINTDPLQEASSYTGSFNAEQDSDGTIRRASLFFRTGNRLGLSFIPSLALQTYLVATGYRAEITIGLDPENPEQKIIQKFSIINPNTDPETLVTHVPVDGQGRLLINYLGPTSTIPYLPAKELFNTKDTVKITQTQYSPEQGRWLPYEKEVLKREFIKDRTFLFGATAIGVYDLRVTPFEKNFPGPETHMNVLANLFENDFIRTHAGESKIMFWALLALGVALSLLISLSGAITGFIITALSSIGIFFLDQWLFKQGLMVTMALPFLLVVFMYIGLTFYKYLTEERKKKHLRSTFSKYVSPAIVDEILKDPENIELGGKKQRMSVFFSDVRGFTTISEKLDPQVLSDVLNKYLTPMTQIVFANKGTLDKYMGDALMAFFGAPIAFDDHAKYACRCALQSIDKLHEIRKEFKAQGLPDIDIGIGINTSEMSVGNMGSDIVRNYTVMGDAVNLGSRLEGINKEYGTRIVISEFTYADIKGDFTVRPLDLVRVKGKNKPVKIFELISEGNSDSKTEEKIKIFTEAFSEYQNKNFQKALTFFQQCLQLDPEDSPSQIYIERCTNYLKEAPGQDWDGVYVMKTK